MKILVIGNGIAGFSAVESIRKNNQECDITMISSENYITYHRPRLSHFLGEGDVEHTLYIKTKDWYEQNKIELLLDKKVVDIDDENKKVLLESKEEISYDKLIIATGGESFVPNKEELKKEGVFVLKDLKQAYEIKNFMKNSKKALIVGAGLLGLEAAYGMHNAGLEVRVVDIAKRIMPRQLDDDASGILESILSEKGVEIFLGTSIKEIKTKDGRVCEAMLQNGNTIECDLILFAVGIKPNLELANKIGLKTDKGILVDDTMKTSKDNIFACGDVAEFQNHIFGSWMKSQEMGRIAGLSALDIKKHFEIGIHVITFKSFGISVQCVGDISDQGNQSLFVKRSKTEYQKLYFDNDKLQGAVMIGEITWSKKIFVDILENSDFKHVIAKL